MIDFGRSVFVCSKPLQFMICSTIARHFEIRDPLIFVVTNAFSDFTAFLEFITRPGCGCALERVEQRANHHEVARDLADLSYASLFIEDDRVSNYHLYAPLKRRYLSVFEEGIGTYVTDYRDHMRGLRLLKWTALSVATGCGLDFGGGRNTDFVLVQFPDLYASLRPANARKAVGIPSVVVEMLRGRQQWDQLLCHELGVVAQMRRSALVLGTWGGVPQSAKTVLATDVDAIFFKAHPHDESAVDLPGARVVPERWIPAEVIVDWLAQRSETLLVYHFGSTIEMNLWHHHRNVEFVDLGGTPEVSLVFNRLRGATDVAR